MRQPRQSARRILASHATAMVVATTGLIALAATPAEAAPVTFPEKCVLNGPTSVPWATDDVGVDLTVSPAKPVYSAGERITVNWHWQTRSSIPVPPGHESLSAVAQVRVGGAESTTLTLRGQPRRQPEAPGERIELDDLTGTFVLPDRGPITFTPDAYGISDAWYSPLGLISCSPTTPPAVSRTLEIGPGPALDVSPARIGPGTRVEFTGEGWPDGSARVELCVNPTDTCVPEWVGSAAGSAQGGHLSGSATIATRPSMPLPSAGWDSKLYLRVWVGRYSAARTVEVTPTDSTRITGSIAPGSLTLRQQASAIRLSDITLDGTAQAMTGALNPVTVTDVRGGSLGWTLTADISDFTSPEGGRIPADHFTWKPSIQADPASPSTAAAGIPGRIAGGSTLASAPPAPHTGGTFTAGAAISLAVPAYQKPGSYNATLTLSIS
ncbi:hypothetical protein [Embleya sp. AB8]|uniref:hypothetical protein n=1 Tax=Embleya sp. AB8 TaxID=3156304 RepID=UPI003C7129B1